MKKMIVTLKNCNDALTIASFTELFTVYAKEVGITPHELKGPCRKFPIKTAREAFWHHLTLQGWSYPAIGRFFNRTHPTIISGVRTVRNMIDTNDPVVQPYKNVIENL